MDEVEHLSTAIKNHVRYAATRGYFCNLCVSIHSLIQPDSVILFYPFFCKSHVAKISYCEKASLSSELIGNSDKGRIKNAKIVSIMIRKWKNGLVLAQLKCPFYWLISKQKLGFITSEQSWKIKVKQRNYDNESNWMSWLVEHANEDISCSGLFCPLTGREPWEGALRRYSDFTWKFDC